LTVHITFNIVVLMVGLMGFKCTFVTEMTEKILSYD